MNCFCQWGQSYFKPNPTWLKFNRVSMSINWLVFSFNKHLSSPFIWKPKYTHSLIITNYQVQLNGWNLVYSFISCFKSSLGNRLTNSIGFMVATPKIRLLWSLTVFSVNKKVLGNFRGCSFQLGTRDSISTKLFGLKVMVGLWQKRTRPQAQLGSGWDIKPAKGFPKLTYISL